MRRRREKNLLVEGLVQINKELDKEKKVLEELRELSPNDPITWRQIGIVDGLTIAKDRLCELIT